MLYYTVSPGDTLSQIAQNHHVSLSSVESANKQIPDYNLIYVGEKILIPVGGSYDQWRPQTDSDVPSPSSQSQSSSSQSQASASQSSTDSNTPAPAAGSSDIPSWATCIVERESGGNPQAQNPSSSASGLFQDLSSTWDNYDGYSSAGQAPASVQIQFNQQLEQESGLSPWAADGCPGT